MNNFTANLDMDQCIYELKQKLKRNMGFGIIMALVMAVRSFILIGVLWNYEFWLGNNKQKCIHLTKTSIYHLAGGLYLNGIFNKPLALMCCFQ